MRCPQCDSNQCQRTERVWQSEIRTRQLPGRMASGIQETIWIPPETITEMSELARSLAPPLPPRNPWMRLWKTATYYFQTVALRVLLGLPWGFSGTVRLRIPQFGLTPDTEDATAAQYRARLAQWRREWFCRQCGFRWIPDSVRTQDLPE